VGYMLMIMTITMKRKEKKMKRDVEAVGCESNKQ